MHESSHDYMNIKAKGLTRSANRAFVGLHLHSLRTLSAYTQMPTRQDNGVLQLTVAYHALLPDNIKN